MGDAAYAAEIVRQLDSSRLWRSLYASSGRWLQPTRLLSNALPHHTSIRGHLCAPMANKQYCMDGQVLRFGDPCITSLRAHALLSQRTLFAHANAGAAA